MQGMDIYDKLEFIIKYSYFKVGCNILEIQKWQKLQGILTFGNELQRNKLMKEICEAMSFFNKKKKLELIGKKQTEITKV